MNRPTAMIFAADEIAEMPDLTQSQWSIDEALPQIGAQPLDSC